MGGGGHAPPRPPPTQQPRRGRAASSPQRRPAPEETRSEVSAPRATAALTDVASQRTMQVHLQVDSRSPAVPILSLGERRKHPPNGGFRREAPATIGECPTLRSFCSIS